MSRRITDCVANAARRMPFETAIIDVREESTAVWSWEKLWRESERIAALLIELGVVAGEAVAYQLPNRTEAVAITLGILRVGGVCCPLSPLHREAAFAALVTRAKARVLFAADEYRGRRYIAEVSAFESRLPTLEYVVAVKASDKRTPLPRPRRIKCLRLYRAMGTAPLDPQAIERRRASEEAPAVLFFTAGTSGQPKGILHSHSVLMTAAMMQTVQLGIDADDRIFVPSSLASTAGFLYGMWAALLLGIPQILQAVWDPMRALRALKELHGTVVQASPRIVTDMIHAIQGGVRMPGSLRIIVPIGAAAPRALLKLDCRTIHSKICGAYVTSEGCLATLGSPTDPDARAAGSDGKPLEPIQIRVCDEEGNVLPPGRIGHLQIHSPTMFIGYVDEVGADANTYTADGWYRTGDLAQIDADGYLYVTGRAKTAAAGMRNRIHA